MMSEKTAVAQTSADVLANLIGLCQLRDAESTGRAKGLAQGMLDYIVARVAEKRDEVQARGVDPDGLDWKGIRESAVSKLKEELKAEGFGQLDVSFHIRLWCLTKLFPAAAKLGTFHIKSAMGCVRLNMSTGEAEWQKIPGTDESWGDHAPAVLQEAVDSIPEKGKAAPGKRGKDGRLSAAWLADTLEKKADSLRPAPSREEEQRQAERERAANVKRAQKTALFSLATLSVDEIAAALRSSLALTAPPKGKEDDPKQPKPVDGTTLIRKLTAVIESIQAADDEESRRRDEEGTVAHPAKRKTA
jgi:hypothetical protein